MRATRELVWLAKGRLTILGHRFLERCLGAKVSVNVDGEDVTSRCVFADRRNGYAVVFKLNADGFKYFDRARNRAAMDVVVGDVQYVAH